MCFRYVWGRLTFTSCVDVDHKHGGHSGIDKCIAGVKLALGEGVDALVLVVASCLAVGSEVGDMRVGALDDGSVGAKGQGGDSEDGCELHCDLMVVGGDLEFKITSRFIEELRLLLDDEMEELGSFIYFMIS